MEHQIGADNATSAAEALGWREGIRTASELRRLAEDLERHHVGKARDTGASWEQVGLALGVSRQAAHTKYQRSMMTRT